MTPGERRENSGTTAPRRSEKMRSLRTYGIKKLLVTSWKASLSDAYHVMHAKNIRHMPVVDDEEKLVGIITERDFHRAMMPYPGDPLSKDHHTRFDPQAVVREWMSWPVEIIDERQSIAEAARLMLDQKISALVVTDGDDVVGIVTTDDLLRAFLDNTDSRVEQYERSVVNELRATGTIGGIAQRLADIGI